MAPDLQILNRASKLIRVSGDTCTRSGCFVDLTSDLSIAMAMSESRGEVVEQSRVLVKGSLRYVDADLANIETLIERMNWQHALWVNDKLPDGMWMRYASSDIDMSHVEARSLFDYVAQVLRHIAEKPGQVPDKSFEKLRNWAADATHNQDRLGSDVTELLLGCAWFSDLRSVRDDIVHRGAETLVFLDKPHFHFQTYRKNTRRIFPSNVTENTNVCDFPLYAGTTYGYLLDFLERLSQLIYNRLQLKRFVGTTQHHCSSLHCAKSWLDRAIEGSRLSPEHPANRPNG